MKKTTVFLSLLLILCLIFSGCSSQDKNADNGTGGAPSVGGAEGDYSTDSAGSTQVLTDRKIITTVYESLETAQYDAFLAALKEEVAARGGYFVHAKYSGNGIETTQNRRADFEIRIPAASLSAFTEKVGTLAAVLSHTEEADDITLSYIDVESRISVLEAEEKALLGILETAQKTEDVLAIRESLTDVQGQLASLRAQKQTYDTLIAYSTVHIDVSEVKTERAGSDGSFFSEVGKTFSESLSAIGAFFSGLGVFLLGNSPIILLVAALAVGIFFLVRYFHRRGKERIENKKEE